MKTIVLVTARSGFPNGYGAASIIRKYSKGFLKCGYDAKVLLLRPSELKGSKEVVNENYQGVYNGVEYEYLSNTCFTSENILIRYWLYFTAVLKCIIYIAFNRKKIEKMFFYSPDFLLSTLVIQIASKIFKVNLIGIKTESSLSDSQRTKRIFWRIKETIIYKLFPSMIVITKHLKDQLIAFGYKKNIKVLPIVVDEDMFKGLSFNRNENTLLYIGTLNYENELISLITSFYLVQKKHRNVKLHIIGGFVDVNLERRMKKLIVEKEIDKSIVWYGKVAASEIPKHLSQGGIMLLPREAAEYSNGGFPIKLGEYLLSGAPTVVTKTGDIEEYLTNNINVFLVEPNNPKLFAIKIVEVIENYENSLLVGKRGKEISIEKFGVKNICKKMLDINHEQ